MSTKRLGFGMMRLPLTDPNDQTSIDIAQVSEMADYFIDRGFTYFDTAYPYHKFTSESAAGKALVSRRDRSEYTITTKLHSHFVTAEKTADDIFNEQLEKTGAGYFDYYLLHALMDDTYKDYEDKDLFNWLKAKKEAGLIKHACFSFHGTAGVLDELLTKYPWIDFVQLQLNYLDWDSETVQAGKNYAVCEKHGIPVVVMETIRGGSLAKLPAEAEKLMKDYNPDASIASWAVRFALGLPNVMMVLSGMSNLEQMKDNVKTYEEFKPLNDEEMEIIHKVVDIIHSSGTIPCTGCAYCKDGCPMHINIPEYFKLYNSARGDVMYQKAEYNNLTREFGKASDCIECGQCEGMCPQSLPIIKTLKDVANFFE